MSTINEIKRAAVVAGAATLSGTDAYTVNIPEVVTPFVVGLRIWVKVANGNTSNSTLAINSGTAYPIVKGVSSQLSLNDMPANAIVELAWSGTNWQLKSLPGTINVSSRANKLFNYYNYR